jgi:hypothetical protein
MSASIRIAPAMMVKGRAAGASSSFAARLIARS